MQNYLTPLQNFVIGLGWFSAILFFAIIVIIFLTISGFFDGGGR